ncbi:enoyl-(Acyl carrier protein) reductase domain-containing protein [Ditylenchus destructor]|nr:enoyl-(Acyl carrier protein) reductase domain-containing protein [Ditylenchus destructor]
MSARFNEKVVIVTGSSAGIGQVAALDFGKEGASLVNNAGAGSKPQEMNPDSLDNLDFIYKVNYRSPGPIRTYIFERTGVPGIEQKGEEYAIDNTSLRRFGESAEVSKIITFLASNDASYVTGALWVVDGGMLLKTPEFVFP